METKNLEELLNQTKNPRCRFCGFPLPKTLKADEQCPNCSANARIVAGYFEQKNQ